MLRLVCLCLIFGLLGLPATAERQFLGYGRLLNNDSVLGDGQDRWHTGSIAASRVWGGGWQGALPTRPGDLLELRLNFQVIAPTQLGLLNPADRPYAGALSVGAHTHFDWHGWDAAMGADLVITGPQTHMTDVQEGLHNLIGFNEIT
ncbi:MAG: lipid A-modifier LpxR family protein, partial [Paracoccaceae bacterium]